MKIIIFTPTRLNGGLGETQAALLRQEGIDIRDITWVIADDLHDTRADIVENNAVVDCLHFDTAHYRTESNIPLRRTLARAYQEGFEIARGFDADIFISLQDYIIPPDDGIKKFVDLAEKFPDCLLTGLMSFSAQPTVDEVVDLDGPWTIFGEVLEEIPPQDGWQDIRADEGPGIYRTVPQRWETNYAAVPRKILHDESLEWDFAYDLAVAFENQDFAAQAMMVGYGIICDTDNHATGLPHRAYWPSLDKEETPLTQTNRGYYEKKWSIPR